MKNNLNKKLIILHIKQLIYTLIDAYIEDHDYLMGEFSGNINEDSATKENELRDLKSTLFQLVDEI